MAPKALDSVKKALPDLILLDVMMPGIDGFEVCRRLKDDPATQDIPIIFITALNETTYKIKGFSLGAVDYVSKPFQIEEVRARVNAHLELRRQKQEIMRKNEEIQCMARTLEEKVIARTEQLSAANCQLTEEIIERKKAVHAAEVAERIKIEFLANIARLYRGEDPENLHDSADLVAEHFPDGRYADVPGLCKVATLPEIEAQGWSLNPGRYVGVASREEDDFDFKVRLVEQNEELEILNTEARELEDRIAENVVKLLEGV